MAQLLHVWNPLRWVTHTLNVCKEYRCKKKSATKFNGYDIRESAKTDFDGSQTGNNKNNKASINLKITTKIDLGKLQQNEMPIMDDFL